MSSRQKILDRLHEARRPFPTAVPPTERLPVTPLIDTSPDGLTRRFIQESEQLSSKAHLVADAAEAIGTILAILAGQKRIMAWDFDQVPCSGLSQALRESSISVAAPDDDAVDFSITGADAALAATGSLVLINGVGRPRTVPLLPLTHIAIITQDQILPNMESWIAKQRQQNLDAFHLSANINIISGPSRTADIGMELILGMHGPAELHIIIIKDLDESLVTL